MKQTPIEKVNYSKAFDKQFDKAPLAIQKAVRKRVVLFAVDKGNRPLHDHPLTGKYRGLRSINITGDWRAFFREEKSTHDTIEITFVLLGTHSQLYK